MLTLAIDTATKVCAVGLCRDGQILAEYRINMGMTQSGARGLRKSVRVGCDA